MPLRVCRRLLKTGRFADPSQIFPFDISACSAYSKRLSFAPMQGTLTQSAYLDACGFIVEETLSSVLNDILTLPDIPEVESHRLNALCKRLDSLKDLFVVNPGEVCINNS